MPDVGSPEHPIVLPEKPALEGLEAKRSKMLAQPVGVVAQEVNIAAPADE